MRPRALLFVIVCMLVLGMAGEATATPTAATVGRKLFFDSSLSDPPGQSCASCHDPGAGFVDPDTSAPVSNGAIAERVGNRNAPSAAYAAFIPPRTFDATLGTYVGGQFWDGRAASLEEQAKGPFLNPLEMNMPSKAAVVSAVASADYAREFKAVFGQDSLSLDDVDAAYDRIASAIAEYERSAQLSPFSSKHDYAMMLTGNARMMTFTASERMGMMLFNGTKAKCFTCHVTPMSGMGTGGGMGGGGMTGGGGMGGGGMTGGGGMGSVMSSEPILFSDYRFANLGIPRNPDNPFYALPADLNPDGAAYIDHGLAAALPGGVDANPGFDGMFRTPSLRNAAITPPYGHNGYFPTLKSIVHFYNARDTTTTVWPAPEVAANVETATMGALGLTPMEEDQLVAFLGTLTDGWWLTPMDEEPPITVATVSGTAGANGWLVGDAVVRLDAIDFGRGVATIDSAVGGDPLTTYLQPFAIVDEGTTEFRYAAKDTAGNVEPTTTESVRIDKTKPIISSTNDGSIYLVGEHVPAEWTVDDAVSGVGEATADYACGESLPTDAPGEYSYQVTAVDVAGNVATRTIGYSVIAKMDASFTSLSESTRIPYRGDCIVSGALSDERGPVADAEVELFSSTDGVVYVPEGRTAVTDATGRYSFSVAPSSKTWYRVSFAGDATRWSATSDSRWVMPGILLTEPADPALARRGVPFKVSGFYTPAHPTTVKIAVYRKTARGWRRYGFADATVSQVGLLGMYQARLTLGAGTWMLRAHSPSDADHASSWSAGSTILTVR